MKNCENVEGGDSNDNSREFVSRKAYPSHGVIGSLDRARIDAFGLPEEVSKHHFRKQKFDFHRMYEKNLGTAEGCGEIIQPPTPLPGLWGLWHDYGQCLSKIDLSSYGRRDPDAKFASSQIYGCDNEEHPLFRTTSSVYGKFPLTVHEAPNENHSLKTTFTSNLAKMGMPKNRSLNIK